MKAYFQNEKKHICIEIFICSLKYINIFLILYTKCARNCLYILHCAANQKRLRTSGLDSGINNPQKRKEILKASQINRSAPLDMFASSVNITLGGKRTLHKD
jgi:hypothetical protein